MIQEINKDTYLIWMDDTQALLVEKYGDRLAITQERDVIDIPMDGATDLIKLLKQLK